MRTFITLTLLLLYVFAQGQTQFSVYQEPVIEVVIYADNKNFSDAVSDLACWIMDETPNLDILFHYEGNILDVTIRQGYISYFVRQEGTGLGTIVVEEGAATPAAPIWRKHVYQNFLDTYCD